MAESTKRARALSSSRPPRTANRPVWMRDFILDGVDGQASTADVEVASNTPVRAKRARSKCSGPDVARVSPKRRKLAKSAAVKPSREKSNTKSRTNAHAIVRKPASKGGRARATKRTNRKPKKALQVDDEEATVRKRAREIGCKNWRDGPLFVLRFAVELHTGPPPWQNYNRTGKDEHTRLGDAVMIRDRLNNYENHQELVDAMKHVLNLTDEEAKRVKVSQVGPRRAYATRIAEVCTNMTIPSDDLIGTPAFDYVLRPRVDAARIVDAPQAIVLPRVPRHNLPANQQEQQQQQQQQQQLTTVLAQLHDDLSAIDGLGEFVPHVCKHLVSSHTFHMLGQYYHAAHHDPPSNLADRYLEFSNYFLWGLLHWHGIHEHCFWKINCQKLGHFPLERDSLEHFALFARTYKAMVRAVKQYAPARQRMLVPPDLLAFDVVYDGNELPHGHQSCNALLMSLEHRG